MSYEETTVVIATDPILNLASVPSFGLVGGDASFTALIHRSDLQTLGESLSHSPPRP